MAKNSLCVNNERQLGSGIMQYSIDYDSYVAGGSHDWPSHWFQNQSPVGRINLAFYYPDYAPNYNLLYCPRQQEKDETSSWIARMSSSEFKQRYAAFGSLAPGAWGAWSVPGSNALLSSYAMYTEGWDAGNPYHSKQWQYRKVDSMKAFLVDFFLKNELLPLPFSAHGTGWNMLLSDGSVQYIPYSTMRKKLPLVWSNQWADNGGSGSVWNTMLK